MLITNISDSCTFGIDFLKKIHLKDILKPIFTGRKEIEGFEVNEIKCGLESSFDVPLNLKCLFEESSRNLNESQKQLCAELLNEFCDFFGRNYCWEL